MASGRIGVLIANLGTPDATDYRSMRRYLKEFLSDKRVIEENSLTWKFVFNVIILTLRPRAKGRDYDSIWNRERERIAAEDHHPLAEREAFGARLQVSTAGSRSAGGCATAIRRLALRSTRWRQNGCDRILYVPLYPQYAAATTATACDAAFAHLATMRYQPTLRVTPPYYDDPVYVDAVAASIRDELAKLPFKPDVILASFHGIPRDYSDKGDPYPQQCVVTARIFCARRSVSTRS